MEILDSLKTIGSALFNEGGTIMPLRITKQYRDIESALEDYAKDKQKLAAFEELQKILPMSITINASGEYRLFIDDIAVQDTIPIKKEQAKIFQKCGGFKNE